MGRRDGGLDEYFVHTIGVRWETQPMDHSAYVLTRRVLHR